ncbi:MAG: N-acetylmuramoyl-L-alanine amidase, partial [Firmicutes bacterium]|nr:N-acetylmuramoyl-L-alanine amidase [Bacillota bacterium]
MSINIIETDWNWNGTLSNRASTDYIALHHAEASSCTAADVDSWHKANGWAGIGYHFFVRKDGSIYRGRPLDKMGAHVSGYNNKSIGICAEGAYMTETMPAAQKT